MTSLSLYLPLWFCWHDVMQPAHTNTSVSTPWTTNAAHSIVAQYHSIGHNSRIF